MCWIHSVCCIHWQEQNTKSSEKKKSNSHLYCGWSFRVVYNNKVTVCVCIREKESEREKTVAFSSYKWQTSLQTTRSTFSLAINIHIACSARETARIHVITAYTKLVHCHVLSFFLFLARTRTIGVYVRSCELHTTYTIAHWNHSPALLGRSFNRFYIGDISIDSIHIHFVLLLLLVLLPSMPLPQLQTTYAK